MSAGRLDRSLPRAARLALARLAAGLLASMALAAPPGAFASAPGEPVTAVRRQGRVVVDGRLDEAEWARAPVFDGFVQLFPAEGAPPSERTEVRVLYDDRALYVAVRCLDRDPRAIARPLGRRDAAPYSDAVTVIVDSMDDHRSAYVFSISAAGVQGDGLLSADDTESSDWDAVWRGAATVDAEGWSAELEIPLSALRLEDRPDPTFGFAVRRTLARRHEESASVLFPRSASGQIARLATLAGLEELHPVRGLELAPYVAARAALRPQYADPARPTPRLLDPYGDVGLDLRSSLGGGLTLQGTVNPDFGQVEADQIIQNLTTYEVFFPEKRPFFTQGMDLFDPVTAPGRASPQQLFYSRRIGLDAPILAAAKVTGSVSDAVQVGVVDAFVDGAGAGAGSADAVQANPPRDVRFHLAQPFRLGPASALPALAPAPRNFLAAVARYQPDERATLGATFTSALTTGPGCTADEAALGDDDRPRRCDAHGGNAAALDWSLRSGDGAWFFRGQGAGSQALDGAPVRVLPDGTRLARGDLGHGAYASVGRMGGEPLRFELQWEYASPKLELNAAGYQRTQNEQVGRAILRWVRPRGGGPFHSYALTAGAEARVTTDGRALDRGRQAWVSSELQLRSFHWVGASAWADLPTWDVREVQGTGVALQRPADRGAEAWFSTDPSRAIAGRIGAGAVRTLATGNLPGVTQLGGGANVTVRPHARAETRLGVQYQRDRWPVRYVGDGDPDRDGVVRARLLAGLSAPSLSFTLRQQLVLTRRLTLQGYAQLFTSAGRYGQFYEARAADGARIRLADLVPRTRPAPGDPGFSAFANPDFRSGALDLNVVVRWEYRLGSTFFLVYTRAQSELGWTGGPGEPSPPFSLRPHDLGAGPATDTLLAKWTYFWRG